MISKKYLTQRKQNIEKEIDELIKAIKLKEKGKLIIWKHGKYTSWHLQTDDEKNTKHRKITLHKKNPEERKKAENLAQKGLLIARYKDLKYEVNILDEINEFIDRKRYESRLQVGGKVFHPDFLILNPNTGKLIVLEHFGMMDNVEYSQKSGAKLAHYLSHGYKLGVNLIITSETYDDPFDIGTFRKLIDSMLGL